MGSPKLPDAPPPVPPPATEIDSAFAGEAEKKSLQTRKGGLSTWLTRGQTLGGGTQL